MTRIPYVHHSTIGRSATNSVAALFKERIIKSHDEHYLENSNNEEVDFDHHRHPRVRRLEDYYDYTPDPVVQQHPWYSNIMLLLLIAMILFTIIYALYQLYQSRQCHHLMYSARCATKPLGGGDDMSDGYSMQPSQTAASPPPPPQQQGGSVTTSSEWKNTTQVEMVPPASASSQQQQQEQQRPQNHNEYISMGEKQPATAGVAMV